MSEKTSSVNNSLHFTKSDFVKIAQSAPGLAKEIFETSLKSQMIQAYAKFQSQLEPIPKNGHTRMYNYVHFNDLRNTVNKAMSGTGLTWKQSVKVGDPVRIPLLDNYGKPAFETGTKVAYTDKRGRKHYLPLINSNGTKNYVVTKGLPIFCATVIYYKNGAHFPYQYSGVVSQSTSPQDVGSAETYIKRYSLTTATGADTATDNDGQQGSRNFGGNQNFQNNYITSGQVNDLNDLISQAADKTGANASAIRTYISQNFAGSQPLNHMFKNKFSQAKSYLNSHMNK